MRRADGGWGAGQSSARPARAWAQRGSGSRTKALVLRVQRRPYMQPAWPPRPAPPCASPCARPRAPLRPPSTSAGRCPLPLAGLGKGSQGSASYLRARGPCASPLLQRPQGRRGPSSGWASDHMQGPRPSLHPFPTAGLTRAHFLWNALSSENKNNGQHDGRCVPGARHRARVLAHLLTTSENGAGPALWRPGRRCQREVGAARSRRQRAAEAPPAESGSRSSALRIGIREDGASGSRAPPQASAPFSQPERRWFLVGVSARGCPCRLPVGAWKDQRLAFR